MQNTCPVSGVPGPGSDACEGAALAGVDERTSDLHLSALLARRPELAPISGDIRAAHELFLRCYRGGGTAVFCGNGGSAADADHWAGELLKGFESRRPLPQPQRDGLDPAIAGKLQGGLPAIPLTGFPALRTAVANDIDPLLEFAQLVQAFGRPGWLFVGISTSGNAGNVCAAAQVARARGMLVLGLTGAGGGRLAGLCDVCLRAPSARTCEAQEYHLPIYHTLCLMLEDALFGA
ncbi:MAG: SIS domain-containing protein [Planctomycetes bacterium]|nr:SIS domain-containing protein [Planctomycetota bacterium]